MTVSSKRKAPVLRRRRVERSRLGAFRRRKRIGPQFPGPAAASCLLVRSLRASTTAGVPLLDAAIPRREVSGARDVETHRFTLCKWTLSYRSRSVNCDNDRVARVALGIE